MLGFGASYHMSAIVQEGGKDFPAWFKIGDGRSRPSLNIYGKSDTRSGTGNSKPEDFDALFRGYGSVLDYPAAMYPAELYTAYPDAKYILVGLVFSPLCSPSLAYKDAECYHRPPEIQSNGRKACTPQSCL
jgi:hypothetical protein